MNTLKRKKKEKAVKMWFPVSYTKTTAGAEHGSCGLETPLHAQVFENADT